MLLHVLLNTTTVAVWGISLV